MAMRMRSGSRLVAGCLVLSALAVAPARSAEKRPVVEKLQVPQLSVEQSAAEFEQRRLRLLQFTARPDGAKPSVTDGDIYSNRAIALLALDRHVQEANERIRRTAEWFDHPHPRGRRHDGECDFAAMNLARAWHLFKGDERLEPATRERIRRFFLEHDFKSRHPSENHVLLFRTSRYLMAQEWPDERFKAYNATGATLLEQDGVWLKQFIRFRARQGWGEFDSSVYIGPVFECLLTLYDYAEDAELRQLAGQMLNLALADLAVDSLNGMVCGAQGRIYPPQALDHAAEGTYGLQYLYFGNVDPASRGERGTIVDAVVSSFRPMSIVLDIALNRTDAYLNRERKHLHNMADTLPSRPLPGSIRKATWYTPHYALGAVQFQDPYPPGRGAWYAYHQQHQWDLSFVTRTRSRLFTHHPGRTGEHNYWTGDLGCRCVSTFMHKTAVLALYDIPRNQRYQFIHAYVPRAAFDEVVEENGWIFVREGAACAALRMLGGHEWTTQGEWKDVEVVSPGAKNGAVCEAGLIADFGSFEAFRREIAENEVRFDPERMQLTYVSKRAGTITIDTKGLREVNGEPVDLDYPTYDCPYIQSEWDSGVVTLIKGELREVLDFREQE